MRFSVDLSTSQEEEPSSPTTDVAAPAIAPEKKTEPHEFIKKILKTNSISATSEDVGAMEAETLGLPEEVGELRDKVKTALRARDLRGNTVKAIAGVLEDLAASAVNFANGLNARLGQDGFGRTT
jgi:NTP pyrophosphatase (non-canonical NTP hydrolase)